MAGRVFQLKATIVGTKPPVWRRAGPRVRVLLALQQVLQGAFGYACHAHEFEVDGVGYGTHDGEGWGRSTKVQP